MRIPVVFIPASFSGSTSGCARRRPGFLPHSKISIRSGKRMLVNNCKMTRPMSESSSDEQSIVVAKIVGF